MAEPSPPERIREGIRDLLCLLADAKSQRAYALSVPIADVPAELLCMWFGDLYHPSDAAFRATFSPAELDALTHFDEAYRTVAEEIKPVPGSIADLQAHPAWTRLLGAAEAALRSIAPAVERARTTVPKDSSIVRLLTALSLAGRGWVETSNWDGDLCAVGIARSDDRGRLVYVSTWKRAPGRYYYECETPSGPDATDYDVLEKGEDVDLQTLLRAMERHLAASNP